MKPAWLIRMAPLLVALALLPLLWMRWDSSENRGFHRGYWGDYNRIHDALAKLPDYKVAALYANKDVAMEEFGFSLSSENQPDIRLDFPENDEIRRWSGAKLERALAERISVAGM